jgi:hypothetical protein
MSALTSAAVKRELLKPSVIVGAIDGERLANITIHGLAFCEVSLEGDCAQMRGFFVSEHVRRRGLGTQLLQAAVDVAREDQKLSITWTCRKDNFGAMQFYRAFGGILAEHQPGGEPVKAKRQKDRPLPLKPAITDALFKRKDSPFWQARFAGADGRLIRRSTGTRNQFAAGQWLTLLKRHASHVSELPPPNCAPPSQLNLNFPNSSNV